MGYRVLARGILHIYTQRRTVAAHDGTVSLVEGCGGRTEADFAIKREFFHGIYTGF